MQINHPSTPSFTLREFDIFIEFLESSITAVAHLHNMDSMPRGVNLHPENHLPSSLRAQHQFDVVVLGSGPAGRTLAARTADAGLKTVIVECELFGGDCPFWACIPSKALLRPAETLGSARQISGARELVDENKIVDVEAVFARRDHFVELWDDTFIVNMMASQEISIVRGVGRLIRDKTVEVQNINGDTATLRANYAVVLATGSSPTIPNIPGLADAKPWTSRDATATNIVPKHLVILGGGVVGCEMATAFASYGKEVTLISSSARLLPRFEPEASKRVQKALQNRGVQVCLSVQVENVQQAGDEAFEVLLSDQSMITGSTILVAVGRRPNTMNIGLENVNVNPDRLQVDDSLRVTSIEGGWLYVIGDANSRNLLTHMGVYQARIAALNIIRSTERDPSSARSYFTASADHAAVTQVVVTDPNVASVGLTLAEAKRRGINAKEVPVLFEFPGAWVHAEFNYDGWAQWVVDMDQRLLIGATFVGREASDLLHASTVAIAGKVPVESLWHAVPSFPTMSEVYLALLKAIEF